MKNRFLEERSIVFKQGEKEKKIKWIKTKRGWMLNLLRLQKATRSPRARGGGGGQRRKAIKVGGNECGKERIF